MQFMMLKKFTLCTAGDGPNKGEVTTIALWYACMYITDTVERLTL